MLHLLQTIPCAAGWFSGVEPILPRIVASFWAVTVINHLEFVPNSPDCVRVPTVALLNCLTWKAMPLPICVCFYL